MNILKMLKVTGTVVAVAVAINMTGFTYAVSSTAAHKIKDYKVVEHNGKVRRSQIAVAVRKGFPSAKPTITATPKPMFPNCYNVRFKYHGEMKRMTFNCSTGNTILSMTTR